jgi:hypothetical protein
MLNIRLTATPFFMTPDGSLNRLAVRTDCLAKADPLRGTANLTAYQLLSRQALMGLLHAKGHNIHGQGFVLGHQSTYRFSCHRLHSVCRSNSASSRG